MTNEIIDVKSVPVPSAQEVASWDSVTQDLIVTDQQSSQQTSQPRTSQQPGQATQQEEEIHHSCHRCGDKKSKKRDRDAADANKSGGKRARRTAPKSESKSDSNKSGSESSSPAKKKRTLSYDPIKRDARFNRSLDEVDALLREHQVQVPDEASKDREVTGASLQYLRKFYGLGSKVEISDDLALKLRAGLLLYVRRTFADKTVRAKDAMVWLHQLPSRLVPIKSLNPAANVPEFSHKVVRPPRKAAVSDLDAALAVVSDALGDARPESSLPGSETMVDLATNTVIKDYTPDPRWNGVCGTQKPAVAVTARPPTVTGCWVTLPPSEPVFMPVGEDRDQGRPIGMSSEQQ